MPRCNILLLAVIAAASYAGCSSGGSTGGLSNILSSHSTSPSPSPPTASIGSSSSTSQVQLLNNVPALFINKQAYAATSLYVYNVESTTAYTSPNWLGKFKGYVDKARTTGVTYLAFELYLHASLFPTSTQPSVIGADLDFTRMDALFDYAQQQGVYLLPTIWVSSPPEWWAALHRDALQLGYDQTAPPTDALSIGVSYDNPDYWTVMDGYVTAIVQRYRLHPALLGWSPSVGITRENNYGPSYLSDPFSPVQSWGDYSPYAKARFRAWLTDKYGSDPALQAAWNDPSATLAAADAPIPVSGAATASETANGAGDTRPSMRDWLAFRLEEKGKEWQHFIALVKTLDPDHVLTINPADALFVPDTAVAQNGTADGLAWTRCPQVDMVRIHPRISYDGTPGLFNTQDSALFAFASAARHAGKIATFALEDSGEVANGGKNIESLARIDSLSRMLASAGAGIGYVAGESGMLPVWSDTELSEASKNLSFFAPSTRAVTLPKVAMLLDPQSEQQEYSLGITNTRSNDRSGLYQALYAAGVKLDVVEVAEIVADPSVLNGYDGIVAADLARLNGTAAQSLQDYARNGGGLFIGGRTGVFDAAGNADYSAYKTLAGLNALPTSDGVSYPVWTFDASSDPLLNGLSGQTVDTANPFYLLAADWAGSGYAALGHATSGTLPATLLKKGNTVIWLPRLTPANSGPVVSLVRNWAAAPDSIGFVGCSLSIQASNGYQASGGTQIWPGGSTGYAGGSLSAWVSQLSDPTASGPFMYWPKFNAMLTLYPNPRAIWWELCPDAATASVTYDQALAALNEIKQMAPNARVYVTGVPIYPADGTHCSINTDAGSQATMDLASQLIANGEALSGPVLTPLASSQVSADGCHANAAGEAVWGNDLLAFFGK